MLMPKCREHAEQVLGTYLQYADHIQCIQGPTLPIGVKGRRKEEEKKRKEKKRKEKKRAVPRAAAAYGRQLKIRYCSACFRKQIFL